MPLDKSKQMAHPPSLRTEIGVHCSWFHSFLLMRLVKKKKVR